MMKLANLVLSEEVDQRNDGVTVIVAPLSSVFLKYLPTVYSFAATFLISGSPDKDGDLFVEVIRSSNPDEVVLSVGGPISVGSGGKTSNSQQMVLTINFNNFEFENTDKLIFKVKFEGVLIGEKEVDVIQIEKHQI